MVICLERDADLHMAHLMPLPLTVSCFSKIQIGFTFLVPSHRGSPGQRAVKRVYVSCGYITFEQITDKEYGFLSVAQPETRNFANFQLFIPQSRISETWQQCQRVDDSLAFSLYGFGAVPAAVFRRKLWRHCLVSR